MRIPTIPPARFTSWYAKRLECENRFAELVSCASSGMNSTVCALYATKRSPGPRDGVCTIASLAQWVVRPVRRTASYFIPSARTGYIACVFPYPRRISFQEAFEALEPDHGKLSCPVLRGPGLSNGVRLLDPHANQILSFRRTSKYEIQRITETQVKPLTARLSQGSNSAAFSVLRQTIGFHSCSVPVRGGAEISSS